MWRMLNVLFAHFKQIFALRLQSFARLCASLRTQARRRRAQNTGDSSSLMTPPQLTTLRRRHTGTRMPTTPRRFIAHLDMDAFYASVELLRYPELRGRPVVVGGRSQHQPVRQADGSLRFACLADYSGRGVITTATYEARALGVHSGMGIMKAAQLAPDALLLPNDFERYRDYSRRFKAAGAGNGRPWH